MQENENLQAQHDALVSENASLKQVIEQVSAYRDALDQTVGELLRANILFKASTSMLEKQIDKLNISLKELQIIKGNEAIAEANKPKDKK